MCVHVSVSMCIHACEGSEARRRCPGPGHMGICELSHVGAGIRTLAHVTEEFSPAEPSLSPCLSFPVSRLVRAPAIFICILTLNFWKSCDHSYYCQASVTSIFISFKAYFQKHCIQISLFKAVCACCMQVCMDTYRPMCAREETIHCQGSSVPVQLIFLRQDLSLNL